MLTKDGHERSATFYAFIDSLFGKISYIACVSFICVLIAQNHSERTDKYIDMLQALIMLACPSPLFKK